MSDAIKALRNAYFRLYYIPPSPLHIPRDYASVTVTKDPEIVFAEIITDDPFFGFELLGEYLSPPEPPKHMGGVIFVFQVSCYVKWEVSFVDIQGQSVRQVHKVFASMPFVHALTGADIVASRATPWKGKLGGYVATIIKAYKELKEIEALLAKVVAVKRAIRQEDIKALKDALEVLETEWTRSLWRALRSKGFEYAFLQRFGSPGTMRVAGTRLA